MVFVRDVGKDVVKIVGSFLTKNLKESKARGVILGLSGGLDSALCAKLCVEILGTEPVHLVFMPETATPETDLGDVQKLSEHLALDVHTISIDGLVRRAIDLMKGSDLHEGASDAGLRNAKINLKPRIRALILFYYANLRNYLVIGTSNKSELLTGYFTKYGDGASDLALIGDLFKTQVFQLAELVGLPAWLIEKKPSPGLAPGVTDEDELKIDYGTLDEILAGMELGYDTEAISRKICVGTETVERIDKMVKSTVHKRRFPRIPKISIYTVGVDRREY